MKTRVLVLHPSSELYGADRILVQIIVFLESCGFEVDVILKTAGPLCALIESRSGAKISIRKDLPIAVKSNVNLRSLCAFGLDLLSFFRYLWGNKGKYSLVYVNTLALFAAGGVARMAGARNIITHSHEIIGDHGLLARLIVSAASFWSDKVFCVSEAVRSDMQSASFMGSSGKYLVVHNGIDPIGVVLPRIDPGVGKVTFLVMGRWMPEKGQWFVVDALGKLNISTLRRIKVLFVGSAPPHRQWLRKELLSLIRRNNLDTVVECIDFVKDTADIYSVADVCLIPSIMRDPFPTTVIEAMSCGLPVVVTSNGGAKEIVENSSSGFLIEPGVTDQLVSAITFLVDNPEKRVAMGQRGLEIFNSHLTTERFRSRFVEAVRS